MFQKCVRALIDDEDASGWKLISRIPSTYVWKPAAVFAVYALAFGSFQG